MKLLIGFLSLIAIGCASPQDQTHNTLPKPDPANAVFESLSDSHCPQLAAFHDYQDRNLYVEQGGIKWVLSPYGSFGLNAQNREVSVRGQIFKADHCTFAFGINGGSLFSQYDQNGVRIR